MDRNIIIIVAALLAAFAAYILYQNKVNKQKIVRGIKSRWGVRPGREYEYYEFQNISRFSERMAGDNFVIDDITWNDLDMDTIFMLLNNTQSSVGQDYLYYMLRKPEFDRNILKDRDKLIEYFRTHAIEREQLQYIFFQIGRSKLAVTDYIYDLTDLKRESNTKHILGNSAIFLSIALLFAAPPIGIFALIGSMGYALISYYKRKGDIQPYILSFNTILKILAASDKIEKLDIDAIAPYVEKMTKDKAALKNFRKNSFWVMSSGSPSSGIEESILEYIRMIFHVDIIKFNSMIEQVRQFLPQIVGIMENIGILESTIAIASFREYIGAYCIPELTYDKNAQLAFENMYHPMIEDPVKNSITVRGGVLLTGSNASGKSTFLKTTAINALLSQSIYTCLAESYRGSFFEVISSMALQDDLMNQESYYIVEIKSLKRILDHLGEERCILCFVDEVLRGTNTVERIAASSQILRSLVRDNVICFAATHDIELTHLLDKEYENYHFQEEVVDNDILFNYVLYKGRATTRNAIKLLSIIGYDKEIIKSAEAAAARFVSQGIWEL